MAQTRLKFKKYITISRNDLEWNYIKNIKLSSRIFCFEIIFQRTIKSTNTIVLFLVWTKRIETLS